MDKSTCLNCKTLSKQYLELKAEIISLNDRLDNLIEHESCITSDVSCQTIQVCYSELACQTDNTIDVTDTGCQTCKPQGIEQSCQSEVLTYSELSCQTDPKFLALSSHDDNILSAPTDSLLSDIFVKANQCKDTQPPSRPTYCNDVISCCSFLPNQPFSGFDFEILNDNTVFDQRLRNRSISYYGLTPYSYGNVVHQSQPIPSSGTYICTILEQVRKMMPDFEYNSVLITKFTSGSDFLGFHSDDEPEIVTDSSILTLSFGETRALEFKSTSEAKSIQTVFVRHGDAYLMTRESQDFYQHSIPADSSLQPRISITLRLLKPVESAENRQNNESHISFSFMPPVMTSQTQPDAPQITSIRSPSSELSQVVYISDSMFRGIDYNKMTSPSQEATVLIYPGATASTLISRIRSDPMFCKLNPNNVTKIYLLCGANNVDQILGIPRNHQTSMVTGYQISESALNDTKSEFDQMIHFLHTWAGSSTINIINILPRESLIRNQVINRLNHHIYELSSQINFVNMVSTEHHRSLFSLNNGLRKSSYFSNKGQDNVHLNRYGIIRLAKYLKYFAHHG